MSHTNQLSFAFAGCRSQGLRALESLIKAEFYPHVVVVLPETTDSELKSFRELAQSCKAELVTSSDLTDQIELLGSLDLLVTCRFNLLKPQVFQATKLGAINIHLGMLPNYRGVHPVSWALINGEEFAGITIHKIDAGIDSGTILSQSKVEILETDDLWSLTDKLEQKAGQDLVLLLRNISKYKKIPSGIEQTTKGFYARRRSADDGKINWQNNSKDIFNLIRALPSPLPSAFCQSPDGKQVSIQKCKVVKENGLVLGKKAENLYYILCADGVVCVETSSQLKIGDVLT